MCIPNVLHKLFSFNRTFHLELKQNKLNQELCGTHHVGVG